MADDTRLIDLERALPAEQFDILVPSMVPSQLPLRASISTDISYAYVEVDHERFRWLRDPSGMVGDVGDVNAPEGRSMTGEVHWALRLRRRFGGWRVEKASRWGSLSAARLAAGAEWAGRVGYLVKLQAGRWVIGPAIADFADPKRYLELIRQGKSRRRRGG